MKRTQNIAVLMTLALLLGQAAAVVHFCSVPHRLGPDGHGVHAQATHSHSHAHDGDGEKAPHSGGHHHGGECFALKWLTAPKTDVLRQEIPTWISAGAPVAFSLIGESEAAPSLDVLAVSPSLSPPAHVSTSG